MHRYLNTYKEVVIQIQSTTGATGTGFYVKEYDVIVTNEHVVKGFREAIINGSLFRNQLSTVLFSDPLYDIAFLAPPKDVDFPEIHLASNNSLKEGEQIMAIGHPHGLKFSATKGIVSKAKRLQKNINYIQIDAGINPGNSGGPLVNEKGEIAGMITYMYIGENLGFALPKRYFDKTFKEYQKGFAGQIAQRCSSCSNIVAYENTNSNYCPECGSMMHFPKSVKDHTVHGPAQTIEEILKDLDKSVQLSRRGKNQWELHQGSATISIIYGERSDFIMGNAYLVRLPRTNIDRIYAYMLKENAKLDGLFFSVNNQDVVLSFFIQAKHLHKKTALPIFQNFLEKADDYDDILVNEYGAIWNKLDE